MEKETGRLEAFSDGIFGVAITLLALEIGISEYQEVNNQNLWKKIIEQWPEYFTYFNSFATVLLMWMGHHEIFKRLRGNNHWVMLLNGLVLLFVVLFPYPTKLVGTFLGTDGENTAVAFYASFTGFITLSMLFLNLFIVKNKQLLIAPEKNLPWFKNMIKGQIIGFILYQGAAILAFYSPIMALTVTFIMWLYWGISMNDSKEKSHLNTQTKL